jgi:hypothetical protein
MVISMARAQALCSASELKLVQLGTRQEIGALSAAKLRQAETRARKMRDKWKDQAALQRRAAQSKAATRDVAANKRSTEKAALFGEVLQRFSAQLAKVTDAGAIIGPKGRQRSTRSARSRKHRAARAEVRGALAETQREFKVRPKAAATKSKTLAASPSAKAVAPARPAETATGDGLPPSTAAIKPVAVFGRPASRPGKKTRRSGKPIGADATAIEAGREIQGLHVTKQQQLLASASAKRSRLQASGLIRIQKNRSAANKRNQGRRDSR